MTKAQFRKKYKELVKRTAKALELFGEVALSSGAIELDDWKDDYRLPKVVVSAGLKDMFGQWRPLNDNDRKEVTNVHITTCADYSNLD